MNPETIRSAFPYLFEVVPNLPRDKQRGGYAMKHDVERLLSRYVSQDELQSALEHIPHRISPRGLRTLELGADCYFSVKPKFNMLWLLRGETERPKGARKAHWEAYQTAVEWAKALPTSPASAT